LSFMHISLRVRLDKFPEDYDIVDLAQESNSIREHLVDGDHCEIEDYSTIPNEKVGVFSVKCKRRRR